MKWKVLHTKKRPLSVSLRCRSTALWVALLSAVLALRLGFLFIWEEAELCCGAWLLSCSGEAGSARAGKLDGEGGVRGGCELSSEAGELPADGVEGMAIGRDIAIE